MSLKIMLLKFLLHLPGAYNLIYDVPKNECYQQLITFWQCNKDIQINGFIFLVLFLYHEQ